MPIEQGAPNITFKLNDLLERRPGKLFHSHLQFIIVKVYRFKSAKAGSGWGASPETAVVLSQCSWRASSYNFRSDV